MNAPKNTIHFFISMAFFSLLLSPFPSAAEVIDRVVAVVNEDVITLSELNQEGKNLFRRITEQAPPHEAEQTLRKARQEMLSHMIDKLIVKQRAEKLGISVSDEEIDAAIERIVARKNATMDDLERDLNSKGTSKDEYRAIIRSQILQSKLISFEIRSKVVITDEKINAYYKNQFAGGTRKEGLHILQMGFLWGSVGTSNSKEEARKRAEEIRKMALDGQSFTELAKSFSDLPSSADGGDIGFFAQDELSEAMRDTILPLKPGEISQVIEIPDSGFQFFKVIGSNKGDETNQPISESMKEDIKELLYQEEMDKQFKKWTQQLREQTYIKELL